MCGRQRHTDCLFLRTLALRSSISSPGEEEDRRELSEGLKEGELLSTCSTDRELGLSSRACIHTKGRESYAFQMSSLFTIVLQHFLSQDFENDDNLIHFYSTSSKDV